MSEHLGGCLGRCWLEGCVFSEVLWTCWRQDGEQEGQDGDMMAPRGVMIAPRWGPRMIAPRWAF